MSTPYPWPPRYEPPAIEESNPWAQWSLILSVIALIFGLVVEFAANGVFHDVYDEHGRVDPSALANGPVWLHGRLLSDRWEVTALLLVVLAVAAGARALARIRRGTVAGLADTVGAFLVCSVTLLVGNALLIGVLGLVASFVVYGRYSGARGLAGGSPTNSTSFPGFQLADRSAGAWERPRGWARTMAIVALGFALPPIPLAFISYAHFLAGLPLTFVAFVLGIIALLRTRATGESGRDWAVGAIAVSSVWLGTAACIFVLNWLLSPLFATS